MISSSRSGTSFTVTPTSSPTSAASWACSWEYPFYPLSRSSTSWPSESWTITRLCRSRVSRVSTRTRRLRRWKLKPMIRLFAMDIRRDFLMQTARGLHKATRAFVFRILSLNYSHIIAENWARARQLGTNLSQIH